MADLIREKGLLYIVATPIGNLGDMAPRAVEVLQSVDVIAAEDTRHSRRLLTHFNIETPLVAYHDHSDERRLQVLLNRLMKGDDIALISDAGTPLISDPGYRLVKEARSRDIRVVPIPGPCALVAALSAAGMPTDRFLFEGFLPAKAGARCRRLQQLCDDSRTVVFYESPHRIEDSLADICQVFGEQREAVIARELTKTFETFLAGNLASLCQTLAEDDNQRKGEFVIIISGAKDTEQHDLSPDALRIVKILAEELPPKQAAALAAKITGIKKRMLYDALMGKSKHVPD